MRILNEFPVAKYSDLMTSSLPSRRMATVSEAKALSHPLRVGILNTLGAVGPRTVSELGRALDTNPGTVLHHVRALLAGGFIEAGSARSGRRGSTEMPYKTTDKARSLSFRAQADEGQSVGAAIMSAAVDGYYSAASGNRFGESVFTLHLSSERLDDFRARLHAVAVEFRDTNTVEEDTEAITVMWAFYRPTGDTAVSDNGFPLPV